VRRAVLTLLATLLAVLVVGPVTAPGAAAATEEQRKYAKAAFRSTNAIRVDRDLVRLAHDDCLQKFANRQAKLLAGTGDLVHQALTPILEDCGMDLVGENLALGYESGRKCVRKGWMKSPLHRANILKESYRRMAIAARQTDDGLWVAVQLFGRKA
jgi:uncharacterized protein YkwD